MYRKIYDANALYDGFLKAKSGSDWKPQVQKFETMYLLSLADMQDKLINKTYRYSPTNEFTLRERGKERIIKSEIIQDRIVKHSVCDEQLNPSVRKYLITDNAASLEDRGIDYTRRRLIAHLSKYYRKNGNNGYILIIDFSKYYDNILHKKLKQTIHKYVYDEYALWLFDEAVDMSKVDVSYMTDKEYANCMNMLFDSIKYEKIDKSLRTGKKKMAKHLNVGDQTAQTSGVVYPIPIDNFIKIVKREKYYARYMDDSYIIHKNKKHLQELLKELIPLAKSIGITINEHKTNIYKLSDYWRFLQIQYSLEPTGRIVRKINPKRLTAMRHKIKKLAPRLTSDDFKNWFYAWFKNHKKYMSNIQRKNILNLYEEELKCTL